MKKERFILIVLLSLIVIAVFKAYWDLPYSEPPCEEAKEDRRMDDKVLKLTSMEGAQEDEEATIDELADDQKERSERYRLSVIEEEKESERAWQDSVLEVIEREHDVRYAYLQLLDVENEEYDDYYEDYHYTGDDKYWFMRIGYFLYDITRDGIPEIWVVVGSPACYYTLRVYTYRNGKAERVIENAGRDPRFYLNRDEHYVVEMCERNPAARCDKILYEEGKFQLIEFFKCWNHCDPIQFETAVRKYKKEIESTSYDEDEVALHEVLYTEDIMPILRMFDLPERCEN